MFQDGYKLVKAIAEFHISRHQKATVGTLRANGKHLPPGVKNAKLKPGDVMAVQNHDGIFTLKWLLVLCYNSK